MTLDAVLDRWALQLERWPVTAGYIGGAGVVTALLVAFSQFGLSALPLLAILYLGPLGLVAAVLLWFPLLAVLSLANSASDVAIALAMAAAVAMLTATFNVLIVRGLRRRKLAAASDSAEEPASTEPDTATRYGRAFTAVLFVLAGGAFIVASVFAGGITVLADGVEYGVPAAEADQVKFTAAAIWWPGFAIAVAGLVLWIRRAKEAKPATGWAAADLVAMLILIIALLELNNG